jgi:3-oxoacyl-[acyl-carrier-protein] synthase II
MHLVGFATLAGSGDWFDAAAHLGRRGWKYLTPATRYLLAAANQALGRDHADPVTGGAETLGVYTGTHHCVTELHTKLYRTLRQDGVGELSPVELPGFAANVPATQLAMALGAQAFALTLTNPVVSGLEAILLGASAIRRGRATTVLATATEQRSPTCPGEGAGAAVLTADAAEPLATVVGGASRFGIPAADLASEFGPGRVVTCGPRGSDVDIQHGTVSPLLAVEAALREPGPVVVTAESGRGHVVALALQVHENSGDRLGSGMVASPTR